MQRTGRLLGRIVAAVVATTAVALVVFLVVVPRILGGATLNVLTGSMSPTIPAGSVVLIQPVEDPLTLAPGDVITFQAAPGVRRLITHRVVGFQSDTVPPSYVTKGDANRGTDIDPVPVGAIRGQVRFHVPLLGYASDFVQGPRGILAVATVVGGAVIADRVRAIRRTLRDHRDEDAATPVPDAAGRA